MARGRHRNVPVRRPLVQPLLGVAVAATMLGGPLLLAAVPSAPVEPDMPTVPTTAAETESVDLSALVARDEAQASRGEARTALPTPTPEPSAEPSASPEPSASLEPSASPEPAPEPTPTEPPAVVGQLWATQDVNVRSGPSAGTERVGYLAARAAVDVSGETADGWTQVVLDSRAGWVNSSYLAESKPEPQPEPEPEPEPEPAAAAPAPAAEAAPEAPSDASCSISSSIEGNLTSNARAVYRAVCAAYGGSVSSFGGYRPGDSGDHGSGRAVDIMVSGPIGWDISRFLQARAGELGITYVIYEQKIWMAGDPASRWKQMEDRGGATANHYDHVHVSVR